MEISAETTYNTSGINKEIKVNSQKLETVTSFKCLGSVVSDKGSKPEILSKAALNDNVYQFGTTGAFLFVSAWD